MADDTISYYPADLALEIANIVTGAHTLDCSRMLGKRPKIVHREHLTADGQQCPHGKHPDATDEQLAAAIWSKLEDDANKHCKGFAKYKITAHYSKPARGTTAESQSFELEVGDPPLRSEADEQRSDFTAELRQAHKDRHKEYIELSREMTALAKAIGTMATGLASAWNNVHERESHSKEHALELKILENEREGERERMRLLQTSVVPMLQMLRGKGVLALGDGDADKPEIVRVSRKLGRSLTAEQLDTANRTLGADRLRELASVDNESDALGILAWLIAHPSTETLYNDLREDQVPMVLRLQELAAEAGEKREAEKVAS